MNGIEIIVAYIIFFRKSKITVKSSALVKGRLATCTKRLEASQKFNNIPTHFLIRIANLVTQYILYNFRGFPKKTTMVNILY